MKRQVLNGWQEIRMIVEDEKCGYKYIQLAYLEL